MDSTGMHGTTERNQTVDVDDEFAKRLQRYLKRLRQMAELDFILPFSIVAAPAFVFLALYTLFFTEGSFWNQPIPNIFILIILIVSLSVACGSFSMGYMKIRAELLQRSDILKCLKDGLISVQYVVPPGQFTLSARLMFKLTGEPRDREWQDLKELTASIKKYLPSPTSSQQLFSKAPCILFLCLGLVGLALNPLWDAELSASQAYFVEAISMMLFTLGICLIPGLHAVYSDKKLLHDYLKAELKRAGYQA